MTQLTTTTTLPLTPKQLKAVSELLLKRRKRLPGDAVEHDAGTGDGSAYFTWASQNYLTVAFFRGRQTIRTAAYRFATQALASEYIESWLIDRRCASESAQKMKQRHSLQVGQVLFSSWGYDQTNVDFYQVVAVRGALVDLRKLEKDSVHVGHMSAHVRPKENAFVGDLLSGKKPNGMNTLKVDGISLSPWNGKTLTATSYA